VVDFGKLFLSLKPVIEILSVCPPASDVYFVCPTLDFFKRWFHERSVMMARCVLWTFDGFGRLLTRFHVSCKSLLRFTIARNRRIDESYITPDVLWMQRSGGKMNRTCGASIASSGFRSKGE
jgi:hypothetical protein